MEDDLLRRLFEAIAAGRQNEVSEVLTHHSDLAFASLGRGATRDSAPENFLADIRHYMYAGDTALHIAAAAHRPDVVQRLLLAGSSPHELNRRKARPLHYAADGSPEDRPRAQAEVVTLLLEAGARPDAVDMSGMTALESAIDRDTRQFLEGRVEPSST